MKSFEQELENIKKICESEKYKNEIEKTKAFLSQKPLILYGAGAVGVSTAKVFEHYQIRVNCFCDKNKTGTHAETGLPIISPIRLVSEYPDANIVISSVNYKDEIIHDLELLGISSHQIFSEAFLNIHEMTWNDIQPHINGYKRAFDLVFDKKSKNVLLERIKCYLSSTPIFSSTPITTSPAKEQYFDCEIITLSDREIFIDGGMYTGDTAEIFFEHVGKNYRHYYGFEPDQKNLEIAKNNLCGKPSVTVISKGLWSREGRLAFSGSLTSSSKLNENEGDSFVDVTSLDAYFRDKAPPTFIKMDIEGAELEALKGAERLIRDYKPKLAICAYHKPEDLYTLPQLIKNYRSDYKFYLRHYTDSIYETVLYAV